MGRKTKRARTLARIARLSGEQETAPGPGLAAENSQKIEELKTKNPEPVIEEPVTLEEPKFMTEAEPVKVVVEEPKVQVKKTTNKAPRKNTRVKKMNTRTKSKSISSKK